ncbi:MAG: hypothetical protein HYV92_11290 [Candidatus Rokubacteria bacterium]|nr:hypothetical protein [Candidatus Rokubacteria bacterium]MBI2554966.1 hypothetical protein [Candidatus Rokubacteria bacterium]
MPSRLASLIRRARRLSGERDRLVESLAREWAEALRGQRLSAEDLEELWAGLIEEAVRRLRRSSDGRWSPEAVRQEAVAVIARVRERVTRELYGQQV